MNDKSNANLNDTLQAMFANNDRLIDNSLKARGIELQKKQKAKISKRDLELALAVLLVELASCDQSFDPHEYQIISNGLMRVFGTTKSEVKALVNQANLVLSNLRGTSKFGTLLKDNLGDAERQAIMEVINEVIVADGIEDGFETYLKHKFSDLLGVALPPTPPST